ncbi:MAG: sulfatase-like hydrolase/transferase [Candidatus Sumerlaeota bacterium]|nr:sulfatase-like hydrolase/transferase [Candidatus Sumerlaeota bacterium]
MNQPNILLITTDQHNPKILGCAGNPIVRTPNLDRLGREGVIFDSAWTPHPVCTPARTTIFTGQYASHHGVPYNINIRPEGSTRPDSPEHKGLRAEAVAFPEVLARNGYATSLFGKLHTKQQGGKNFGLQFTRLAEGKGQFIEQGAPPDDYRQYLRSKGYDDEAWKTWKLPDYPLFGHVVWPHAEEDYIDTWTATEAMKYLESAKEPFFAWVSFSNPHTPWDPPAPYAAMYSPDEVPMPARRRGELEEKHPTYVDNAARTVPAIPTHSVVKELAGGLENAYSHWPEPKVRAMLAAYYGEITHIDAQVGRLLALLDERGLRENTLIVFTADHGDYLGNNWDFYKAAGCFYESLGRVPFLINWPGRIAGGRRCDALVSLTDLAPTFLEAAALKTVDPFDGRSLWPLLKHDGAQWRSFLRVGEGQIRCVVTKDWKYWRWRDGFEELYHRSADPHDLYNLAKRPECEGIKKELAARLAKV